MRLLALPILLLMACNCATVAPDVEREMATAATAPTPPPLITPTPAQPPSLVQPKEAGDQYWVPALHYHGGIDGNAVKLISTFLAQAVEQKVDAVVLILTTPGGNMDNAYDIATLIENSPLQVVCVSDYETKSAGFYILQSCDKRLMTKRSSLMTHDIAYNMPTQRADEVELRNDADDLLTSSRAAAEHNARRMRCSPEYMEHKLIGGRQWLFNWQDALRWRAVDGVVTGRVWNVIEALRKTKKLPADLVTEVPKPGP